MSELTKHQIITKVHHTTSEKLVVQIRHDDQCGNGHNSFAITADVYEKTGGRPRLVSCGCLHDEVAAHFPKLAPYLKWHLCSTDGPMHYVANTIYWAEQDNAEYARNSAIWPDATLEQLQDKEALKARLPALMAEFKSDIESLGLVF